MLSRLSLARRHLRQSIRSRITSDIHLFGRPGDTAVRSTVPPSNEDESCLHRCLPTGIHPRGFVKLIRCECCTSVRRDKQLSKCSDCGRRWKQKPRGNQEAARHVPASDPAATNIAHHTRARARACTHITTVHGCRHV